MSSACASAVSASSRRPPAQTSYTPRAPFTTMRFCSTPLSLIEAASSAMLSLGVLPCGRAWRSSDSTSLLRGTVVRGDAAMTASISALENFIKGS
jgi:hypothetical protein